MTALGGHRERESVEPAVEIFRLLNRGNHIWSAVRGELDENYAVRVLNA